MATSFNEEYKKKQRAARESKKLGRYLYQTRGFKDIPARRKMEDGKTVYVQARTSLRPGK